MCRILTSRLKIREYKIGHTNNYREAELTKHSSCSTDLNLCKSRDVNLSRAVVLLFQHVMQLNSWISVSDPKAACEIINIP